MTPRATRQIAARFRETPWTGLLTALVFAAFLYLYRGVLAALAGQWLSDENYQHGMLVPLISALLLYRHLRDVPDDRRGEALPALALVLPGLGLLVLGLAAAELFTMRASMLLVFWGLVVGVWGRGTFKALRFPLLFLVFMIPLPYVIFYRAAFPLQLASAAVSAGVLEFLGMPLVRTGNIIHLGEASLDVVTACSGLRSLLALVTFGTLAAGLLPLRPGSRVLLVALAVPVAMLTNALRIILTAILVHTSGRIFLQGALHQALGLLTFALGIGLLFLIGGAIRWRQQSA